MVGAGIPRSHTAVWGKLLMLAILASLFSSASEPAPSQAASDSQAGSDSSCQAAASPTFADVPCAHPHYDDIEALYQAGYTAGCSTDPLLYCPEQAMNRAESAVFVERGIHSTTYSPPAPASQVFADLPLDSWAANWVNGLWTDSFTSGCGTNPLVFCPWQGHTRAEGTVFYLRMLNGATFTPPEPAQQTFADVPLDAWYAKWVEAAYAAGLIPACQATPSLRFCPDDPLTRAMAAHMMVHAKGLTTQPPVCSGFCGNGTCESPEDCSSCPEDCGTCVRAKEIYADPDTGKEVWRMTNYSGNDLVQYYHHPTMSPNGRYLIFRTSRSPYIWLITSDGATEKAIGDYSTWNSQRQVDFSTNNLQGWWSHDSRFYYAFSKLYVIDVEGFLNNRPPAEYISQISGAHAEAFFYPMVSPDGRTLFGLSISHDVNSGGAKLKLINVDGSDYREFDPPYYYYNNGAIDVTHGWLGNARAWYQNRDPIEYIDMEIVFEVKSGSYSGRFDVTVPGDVWSGIFDHPTVSPSAYFVGEGSGRVAGFGRGLLSANTKYWSRDPVERELVKIGPSVAPHPNFSPDGRWLLVGDTESTNMGMLVIYPVPPNAQSPILVARFRDASAVTGSQEDSAYPTWSPDGTKIIFRGYTREPSNSDIYVAVFEKPSAPTEVTATRDLDQIHVTWKPAGWHREIREYKVFRSTSASGDYQFIATFPATLTYLDVPSKLGASETTLMVDSTEGFPSQGAIEVSGLSTEIPSEIITYTGKTATSFTGCTRGAFGSTAAEHWNDSFVWSYTGQHGFLDSVPGPVCYRVRSVEWSGLVSPMSEPSCVQ